MHMRVDDEVYPHAGRLGGPQIGLDVANGINDRAAARAAAAEEVGDATGSLWRNWRRIIRPLRAQFAPSSKAQHVEALPGWGEKFIQAGLRATNA